MAIDELRQKESELNSGQPKITKNSQKLNYSFDMLKQTNISQTTNDQQSESREDHYLIYSMLISALVNGRLTSDISLSFKVPDQPETNAIVDEKSEMNLDLGEGNVKYDSQNLSISRYKKPYLSESHQPKDTSAASFTTSSGIKQLPLIWTLFLGTILILVSLILIVLTKLHSSKQRSKRSQVRFMRKHHEMTDNDFVANGLR